MSLPRQTLTEQQNTASSGCVVQEAPFLCPLSWTAQKSVLQFDSAMLRAMQDTSADGLCLVNMQHSQF